MKRIIVLNTIMALMISPGNTIATTLYTPVVAQAPNVMPNARHHAKNQKVRLKSSIVFFPPSPEETIVDNDTVLARNRNRIEIVDEEEEELSDHVKIRLMIARIKALEIYRKAQA